MDRGQQQRISGCADREVSRVQGAREVISVCGSREASPVQGAREVIPVCGSRELSPIQGEEATTCMSKMNITRYAGFQGALCTGATFDRSR